MNYTDRLGNINLYNGDCMEFMKDVPDKYYDLAIVSIIFCFGYNLSNEI